MIRMQNMRLPGIVVGLLLCSASCAHYAQAQPVLPKVLVIATGGTIAGEQAEPGSLGPYSIKKSVNEVVALVPQVTTYAQVETEQFSNVPSPNITPEQWLKLAKRINAVFNARTDLAGIVVTHGTARLEETAFFLHLTVKSERPVVVLGAQRPPTAISPDGPINLLSAIRVAAAPESRNKGVLVVMDDRVISARDAQKLYARNGGFAADEMGMIGVVAAHGVEFFYEPVRRHTARSEFDIDQMTALPRVDVHYSYAGSEGPGKTDAKAVIVATTGFSPGERSYYEALQKRGVVIATTFPSGDHVASPAFDRDVFPTIVVQRLLPTHARILMMLALTKTQDLREIQRIFQEY
jgi:L-asparaginase type II